ncbi:hypothetical protein HLB23_04515 [Nocardia uniformis]|uniref:Uncharacterized protein n=1 Tax=Nocardia uniformis TaxID=53432 RepID=A0A849BXZ1_9NOCA|nr:hypothetical protein [Nocardia uniformis]NNH69140.1 hypothetical protein [Nocardia uniformis]
MASRQVSIRVDERVIDAIERISGGNRSQGFEKAAQHYLLFAAAQSLTAADAELLADFDATCDEWRSA